MTPPQVAIVIGSFNRSKAREMVELLDGIPVAVRTLSEFEGVSPVEETGLTFAENARQKALGWARQTYGTGVLGVVADDSGLEVDALGGRPGVFSARYISEKATDPERVQGILAELADLPPEDRTARFRCHVAFADDREVLIETEGVVEGRIAFKPAGESGFGYDPIFVPEGYDRTFAELGYDVKHRISHRAAALRLFRDQFASWLSETRKGSGPVFRASSKNGA